MSNTDSIKPNTVEWNEIDWRKVELSVFKHSRIRTTIVVRRLGRKRVRKANFPSQQK